MKAVIFNGAPGSGKDTFGDLLDEEYSKLWLRDETNFVPEIKSFKTFLVECVRTYYNIERKEWNERYDTQKEEPWIKLNGLSQREALIDMSEVKMKPLLGKDIFGKAVAKELSNTVDHEGNSDLYIFTDGGFVEEIQPIVDKLGVENILIIRLHRPGYTFEGDSRGLLNIEGITSHDVDSLGIDDTFEVIEDIVQKWLEN